MTMCANLAVPADPTQIRKPWVGSLVFSPEGELVGRGTKEVYGDQLIRHAERTALEQAGTGIKNRAKGGVLFTTLEPCVKMHRNQILKSCAELIVEQGIDTVVYGMLDGLEDSVETGLICGRGIGYLRNRGVNTIQFTTRKLDWKIRALSYRREEFIQWKSTMQEQPYAQRT